MTVDQLTFFGWFRPPGADLVGSGAITDGRLSVALTLTVRDADHPGDTATNQLAYDLFGPGDVTALTNQAVRHHAPAPFAANVESDKAVHAELAAVDLPWRYTVDRPQNKKLRPWIVLLVGTSDEIEVTGPSVRVQPAVLDAHPLADSARLAHLELDTSGRTVSRLISPRPLVPDRDHVAVIVPAFTPAGTDSWTTPAAQPVELTAYHHWTFRTKAGGDFATLARRLRLLRPAAGLGAADVAYGPLPAEPALPVRGALFALPDPTAPQPSPAPVTPAVDADLVDLTAQLGDEAHPVLGLPDLGAPWPADPSGLPAATGWRDALRHDYRVRSVAGLGERAGVINQELLAAEAGRLAGAYEEAMDALRRMSLGLLTARSLWARRVPSDPTARLAVLGPALRDVLTAGGPVAAAMEHPERALERSLFSSAAQRALRVRTSDNTPASAGSPARFDPARVLHRAAAAPPSPVRSPDGAIHTDLFARQTGVSALDDVTAKPAPPVTRLRPALNTLNRRFDRGRLDPDTATLIDSRMRRVVGGLPAGRSIAILPLLELLDAGGPLSRERARVLAGRLDTAPDADDLAELAATVSRRPPAPVSTAFDVGRAAVVIGDVFDPTSARPAIADRVLGGLFDGDGPMVADPGAAVELRPDIALPAWKFLRDEASDWLLPGVGELDDDVVVGLTTNPAFVDAFLLGLNFQVLSELRFRNHPIIPGWTPVRTFWERANPGTSAVDDDIVGIEDWQDVSQFGDPSHQPPSAASADLVILFHSALFREYPGTVVSLVPAARNAAGTADWTADPDFADRQFPSFQGQITSDLRFFGFDLDPALGSQRWVVLEETLSGRRFFNAATRASTATNGADYASETFSPPRRVMIRGDILLKVG